MWNRVNLIYLPVCISFLSLRFMHSSGQPFWELILILVVSLSYPFFLVLVRPDSRPWRGALWLLLILSVALFCDFVAGVLWYVDYQHLRLGSEFNLPEVLGWYMGEGPAFFLVLVVLPAAVIAGVCYPIGYLASRLIFRRKKVRATAE